MGSCMAVEMGSNNDISTNGDMSTNGELFSILRHFAVDDANRRNQEHVNHAQTSDQQHRRG